MGLGTYIRKLSTKKFSFSFIFLVCCKLQGRNKNRHQRVKNASRVTKVFPQKIGFFLLILWEGNIVSSHIFSRGFLLDFFRAMLTIRNLDEIFVPVRRFCWSTFRKRFLQVITKCTLHFLHLSVYKLFDISEFFFKLKIKVIFTKQNCSFEDR